MRSIYPVDLIHALTLCCRWARCEPTQGHFDFAWLDEAVFGMHRQGVTPWIQVSSLVFSRVIGFYPERFWRYKARLRLLYGIWRDLKRENCACSPHNHGIYLSCLNLQFSYGNTIYGSDAGSSDANSKFPNLASNNTIKQAYVLDLERIRNVCTHV